MLYTILWFHLKLHFLSSPLLLIKFPPNTRASDKQLLALLKHSAFVQSDKLR